MIVCGLYPAVALLARLVPIPFSHTSCLRCTAIMRVMCYDGIPSRARVISTDANHETRNHKVLERRREQGLRC